MNVAVQKIASIQSPAMSPLHSHHDSKVSLQKEHQVHTACTNREASEIRKAKGDESLCPIICSYIAKTAPSLVFYLLCLFLIPPPALYRTHTQKPSSTPLAPSYWNYPPTCSVSAVLLDCPQDAKVAKIEMSMSEHSCKRT